MSPVVLLGTQTRESLSVFLAHIFTPNASRGGWPQRLAILGAWYVVWIGIWLIFRPAIFPSPLDVLGAFQPLWMQDGLGQELLTSLSVSLEALAYSTAIALPLAYVCRVPGLRPFATGTAELRFLSPAVFYLLLLFLAPSAHAVKVWMLTIGEACFLVTSMIDVVDAVPNERFDDCRTLRMSEWQATWYVVVRGTLHDAIKAIRANNAMGWAALMMVEGIVRSEGGAGVLILNNEKHFEFASVWAIATAILVVGLVLDYAIGQVDRVLCPYAVEG